MRIRSIKPEFWRSDDITSLEWDDRLLFVGLWSYVDDNGVGIDRLASIVADLFAGDVETDPRETFARVSRGLQRLAEADLIARYKVGSKRYLYVTGWTRHQRVDRPNKPRYPLPTCDDAESVTESATPSRDIRETPSSGTGEQGNRGTGEQPLPASADAERGQVERDFAEWYLAYPRKKDKGHAVKAYRAARKKASAAELLDGLKRQIPELRSRPADKVPYPATWLNGERWTDEAPDVANDDPYRNLRRFN